MAVPVERLYDAFVDAFVRAGWLLGAAQRTRTAALEHERLADAEQAARMKAWRERLGALKSQLEAR